MKKTLFLTAVLGAAFAAQAMADDVTVTINGTEYTAADMNGTTDTAPTTTLTTYISTSGGYFTVSNTTTEHAYVQQFSSANTVLSGAYTKDDTAANTALFVDTHGSGNVEIQAKLILNGDSSDALRMWTSGSNYGILNDVELAGNSRAWIENGTHYIEGVLTGADKSLTIVGSTGTLKLSGGATLGTLNLTQSSTVTLSATDHEGSAAADTSYTIGTVSVTNASKTVTVEEGVTLAATNINATTLTNAGTISATNLALATLTNTGTLELTGAATLTKTLTVTGGALDLSGATSIGADSTDNFVIIGSSSTGNGYDSGKRLLISYTGDEMTEPTTYTGAGAFEGKTIAYESGKGLVATVSDAQTEGTYYISTSSSTSAETDGGILGDKTTAIGLVNGATLTLNEGWTNQKTINSASGTVSIDAGVTLNRTALTATGTTKLAGAGQYLVETVDSTLLGSNVSVGTGWTGTVTLKAGNSKGMNLGSIANSTSSKIEFNGVSGWDSNNWAGTMSYNATLTDNDDTAAWTNGAYSTQSTPTGTFSGAWTGDGKFVANLTTSGAKMNYTYTGNISGWTGTFEKAGNDNSTTTLTFGGNATAINATITKTAGTLNVVSDANQTFNGAITANALTVNSGKTATILGDTTVSSIEVNGTLGYGNNTTSGWGAGSTNALTADSVTVNAGGTFQFRHDDTTVSATINLNGGTLSLFDTNNSANGTTFSKVNIQAASTISDTWKGNYTITELTGAGNISLNKGNTTDSATLTIATLKDYSGTISNAEGHVASQWTTKIAAVDQADGQKAVINTATTLTDGFTKSGAGEVSFMGDLTFAGSVTLDGGTLTIETTDGAHDGTLSVADLTIDATSTLNSNLVMGTGTDTATITFAEGTSVTLGCTLDLGANTKIVMDANDIAKLDANNTIDLFTGVDALGTYLDDGGLVWIYDENGVVTTHALGLKSDGQGGYTVYATPEPATATLSLLALAGLCARRRRRA